MMAVGGRGVKLHYLYKLMKALDLCKYYTDQYHKQSNELCGLFPGDHVRQDSMDFSKDWEDPGNCRCSDRLKPLERRKARQHQRCLAHSLVGTPNYIAPEVLLRTGTVNHS